MRKPRLFLGLALALALPLTAQASTIAASDTVDLNAKQTVEDNLYVGGGTVSLNGDMSADVLAAGGNLTVTGATGGDLTAAGGSITLLGPIAGDLRTAGGSLTVNATIGGELMAAGGNITVLPDVSVANDARLAGGVVSVKGAVGGDLVVYAGTAYINGTVEGDVRVTAEELNVGPDTVIIGSLTHTGPRAATVAPEATIQGGHEFVEKRFSDKPISAQGEVNWKHVLDVIAAALVVLMIIKFLTFLITSILAVNLFPKGSRTIVNRSLGNFGPDLLTGFLTAVAAPLVIGILLTIVVGWLAACLLIFGLLLISAIGAIYAPVIFGSWIMNFVRKQGDYPVDWKAAMLGTVCLSAVVLIPFVGWLAGAIVYLASCGSLLRLAYERYLAKR